MLLGVSFIPLCDGIFFSSPCCTAAAITLRIFRLKGSAVVKTMDIALDPFVNRTGDVWHIEVHMLRRPDAVAYCWLASGEVGWKGALRFAPGLPLLDPYATIALPVQLPTAEQSGRTVFAGRIAPMSGVASLAGAPALRLGRPLRPRHSLENLMLLEVDPFTFALEGEVAEGHSGKWLGVLDRVEYIKEIGVTAVMVPCPMLRGPGLGVQVRCHHTVCFTVEFPLQHQEPAAKAASKSHSGTERQHNATMDCLWLLYYTVDSDNRAAWRRQEPNIFL
jgi:hypothetical protein